MSRPKCSEERNALPRRVISRRQFLREAGAAALGLLAAGCWAGPAQTQAPDTPTVPTEVPTDVPTPTELPTDVPPTSTSVPTATTVPTDTPVASPTDAPAVAPDARPRVAIASAADYDRVGVHQQVEALLDGIGGLEGVVGAGDRVAIKVNLTGGVFHEAYAGAPAVESYATHPEVVRALCELLRDAGASELFIVEAIYEWDSYRLWGYEEVAASLGATLIDLNASDPYADFLSVPVVDSYVYDHFVFHHILQEVDAFISVAKMKCHWCCGVTHAMKNLVGLVPLRFYRLEETDGNRSALHGPGDEFATRLPRVIMDLNRARPIDLALVDGIRTAEGGEGPWNPGFSPVQPGVLVAGRNALAVDTVATAVMGFDPAAERPAAPFLRADNHLNLARDLGLGTNALAGIQVVGASIDDVRYPFEPCWQE